MNRRLFLSKIALSVGAIALAPAINLLEEPKTPFNYQEWTILLDRLQISWIKVQNQIARDLILFGATGIIKTTKDNVEYVSFFEANKLRLN